jgi:excisionase family DNA binding protein
MTATQSDPADELPRLLNITDLADHLGVNVRHIRRLVHERRIPFIKWGHLIRFKPADIAAWIDANRIEFAQLTRHAQSQPATPPVRSRPRRRSAQTAPSDHAARSDRLRFDP